MQENYEQFKCKSLYDLKNEGVINFSNGFGGWGDGAIETGHNNLFFVRTERSKNSLMVIVKNKSGNEVSHSIRSEKEGLLAEIEEVLKNQIGKSVSEIYNNKTLLSKN